MSEESNHKLAITIAVLNERLESIEEKLDSIVLANTEKHTDLEMRVRMVERWMYAVPASIVTCLLYTSPSPRD